MADTKHDGKQEAKKKTSPLVYIGIGCLILVALIAIGTFAVGKFVASKVKDGMLGKVIENQTGIKTNIQDLENGKMTFTDEKTGTTVNLGSGEVPETFPKDFPIYPGAKVTSSLSGANNGQGNGFWLTLTTSDPFETVTKYYTAALRDNGWTTEATAMYAQNSSTQTVKKGTLTGSVSIMKDEGSAGTQIVIVMGEDEQ